jgi:glyoxylase-like metal-dependent hydrolase (beta-lactamase superfamily II)/rhodanese-related sulfurtransferase
MRIQQIYTKCLAEASYYIESNGVAAVIDPIRESEPYLELAAESGAKIKYVFETHFHADFVSGHIDLAKKTGATIVFGPSAETDFESLITKEGDVLEVGDLKIEVLHTPGHTPESTTYLLSDENGKNHAIFTGDTLFIGDVGRPDLAIPNGLTTQDLAGMLFDSLRNKIMPLADDVIVYPAHGAGSACGKNLSSDTFSTLGEQKKSNYALNPEMTREAFIKELTTDLPPMAQYMPKNAAINKTGYDSIDEVLKRGQKALSLEQFETEVANGALILDTRHSRTFITGFVPGSMSIGLNGSFAVWVGNLIENIQERIVIITEEGKEEESVSRLARVGYDNAIGYLKGGIDTWKNAGKPLQTITSLEPSSFAKLFQANQDLAVIDVRKPGEYNAEHLENVDSFPLDFIRKNVNKLDPAKTYYIHCASGYRSIIASSMLKAKGIDVIDLAGGIKALRDTELSTKTAACSASA